MRLETIETADIPYMMELLPSMHLESYYRNEELNIEYFKTLFASAAAQERFAYKLVNSAGCFCGYMIASLSTMSFCSKKIAMDDMIYILPDYRGNQGARLLLEKFFLWCQAADASPVIMLHFLDNNSKTYKFLERFGMRERGRIFIKENK